MSTINYENELKYIHHLAQINGYNKTHINNILKKHLAKKHLLEMSTIFNDTNNSQSFRRICIALFIPLLQRSLHRFSENIIMNLLQKVLIQLGLCLVATKILFQI